MKTKKGKKAPVLARILREMAEDAAKYTALEEFLQVIDMTDFKDCSLNWPEG